MLRTTQRRKLRLFNQSTRITKIKRTWRKNLRGDDISDDTGEEDSTHDEYDQDSSISFDDEDDDSTVSREDYLEDWIENTKRSAKEDDEKC